MAWANDVYKQKVQMSTSKPKFKSCLQKCEKLSQYYRPLNSIENEVKAIVMIDKEVELGPTHDEKTTSDESAVPKKGKMICSTLSQAPKKER